MSFSETQCSASGEALQTLKTGFLIMKLIMVHHDYKADDHEIIQLYYF